MLKQHTIWGLPFDQTAQMPAEAFVEAIDRGDADAARAVCAKGSWEAKGDTPRRLFLQAVRKRLTLRPTLVGRLHEGRASIRAVVTRHGEETPLQDLWLLLIQEAGFWKLAAPTKSRPVVGLFLRGELTLPAVVSDLPPSEPGAIKCALEELRRRGGPDPERSRVAGTATLSGRAAVRFVFTDPTPSQLWVVLGRPSNSDEWSPLRVSQNVSLETFFGGLEIPWPTTTNDPTRGDCNDDRIF